MKSWMDKCWHTYRLDFFCLVIPFILWIFCFRHFFSSHVTLMQDAVSYSDHINYYTDNLSKGVYPLWDPEWLNGAPYHFFLRRMGDVNPFLFLIVFLKCLGVPSIAAYLIFLGIYYFLAGWAFYLITRMLLADRFFAFSAYILFLFSSWGSEIFYNYIVILFVPIIWFFYFLLCFSRAPAKKYFLGACFCVGLILTTYIPFFFLTIIGFFTVLFILFYGRAFTGFLKQAFTFSRHDKIFTTFCILFLLISCIPALTFYKESKGEEFVLPDRHSGSGASLPITVGLSNIASGDIINHGFFDRVFSDQQHLDMGDIFVPYMFFTIFLAVTFARVNKLIFFLLFNILALSLIAITSAGSIHRFLYDHFVFFKIIRNIYYFFWLAILPMAILLSVTAFRSLLTAIDSSSKKWAWLIYILVCHLIFVLFLFGQQGVLSGAWAAIFISMVYFFIYCRYTQRISYPFGFAAILLAVFIQSAQVYGFLENRIYKIQQDGIHFDQTHKVIKETRIPVYYAARWFDVLVNYLDPAVFDNYRRHQFIIYDTVLPYDDSPQFLKIFETSAASNADIAYVPKDESNAGEWRNDSVGNSQPDLDPIASGKLSVLSHDANTWKIKAHLASSAFLVINDNYNSSWHAFINGRPVHLLRANVSFKGVWVPAGESVVLLRFATPLRYMRQFALIILFAGTFVYLLILFRKSYA